MGLSADVAILTAADAAKICHEPLLTNLDDPTDTSATIANALAEATNELIRRVRGRNLDPSLVDSATVTDLRAAAAFYALYTVFSGMEQDDATRTRAAAYKARFEEQMSLVVIRTTSDEARSVNPLGTPVVRNHDSAWIAPGRDTRPPGTFEQTWVQRL